MATTAVTTPGRSAAAATAGPEPTAATETGQPVGGATTPPPADAPGPEGRGDGTATTPSLGYSLLTPPDYGNIVGGVPPSPFVSLILLAGAVVLIAAAVAPSMGVDSSEWWLVSALLLGVAVFLAGFVSRSA